MQNRDAEQQSHVKLLGITQGATARACALGELPRLARRFAARFAL